MNNFAETEQRLTEGMEPQKFDNIGFIVFRLVFVILIAIFILCMRYFVPDYYKEIKYYYDNYVSVNITADYYLTGD